MFRFLPFLIGLALVSCADNSQEEALLQQQPYAALTDSITRNPEKPDLYYRRGVLLYRSDEKEWAEKDLKKAWAMDPREPYALSLVTLLREKSPDSAIVFIQQALKKLPGSIALSVGLARGYQQKQDTAAALSVTDNILQRYPGQLDALTLKSELLSGQNKQTESLKALEKAHTLVPSDPAIAYDLAYAYASAMDDRTVPLTDSLIKAKAPEIEKAFYSKALYFIKKGNTAGALQNFDLAIRSNYNFLDAYLDKGELLYNLKRYDEATRNFQTALKVDPATALFYFWMGKIQEAQGDKAEAKLNYQKAYGLDKEMEEAKKAADRL